MKVPAWAKIFLIFTLVSLLASALGSSLVAFLIPIVVIVFMVFPGKDLQRPILFKLAPIIWSLSMLSAATLLVADWMGKEILSGEVKKPSTLELYFAIVSFFPTIFLFYRRHRLFRWCILLSCLGAIFLELSDYYQNPHGLKEVIEMLGSLTGELLLSGYLFINFKKLQQ